MFARATLAAFVLSALASAAFAADCTRTYTVKEGDWCDTISAANNVSTYQLAAVNPGIDSVCHNLIPGTALCLGTSGEDCTSTHVVTSGESCESIMSTYSINATMFWGNNPQISEACDNVYTGEVLCVANEIVSPIAATASISVTVSSTVAPTTFFSSASSTSSSSAAAATTTAADEEDSDDEDLPFCDEL